jgi:8-oxo-dGTP pyrophosphatase MutT (NUDIX family)
LTCKLRIHAAGDWRESEVRVSRAANSRRIVPEVEPIIDQTWSEMLLRPGVHLFDGPMCRYESWGVRDGMLHLSLSTTSYRIFAGTNLMRPDLADQYGPNVLANPVGVSAALLSSDGYLMFGVRNHRVAYYPNRIHPFAGAVEPTDDLNLFGAVRRELAEELSLTPAEVPEIRCTGIVEDIQLRQPELIFRANATPSRAEIESRMDTSEHHEVWSVRAEEQSIEQAVQNPQLTPVAVASLLLWGRLEFGSKWFDGWIGKTLS